MIGIIVVVIITLIVIPCLLALPTITIDTSAIIDGTFYGYIRSALYFVPVRTVAAILTITLALFILRVVIAFVRTIWDVLPLA